MEIDHSLPESLGGRTEEPNLWLAGSLCNDHKGDRVAAIDPITGEVSRLFNPSTQTWTEHFLGSAERDLVVGRTSTGRATVVTLNLNRPSLVRSRRAWVKVGWHPPED